MRRDINTIPSDITERLLLSMFPQEELRALARLAGVPRGRCVKDTAKSLATSDRLTTHLTLMVGLKSNADENFDTVTSPCFPPGHVPVLQTPFEEIPEEVTQTMTPHEVAVLPKATLVLGESRLDPDEVEVPLDSTPRVALST